MTTIHQAIFGDKDNEFSLLQTTGDINLSRRIANATDIYEQTPDGIAWRQTLRGFAWEDYYLLIRTFMDQSPTVRTGRVYSHCLIIPISAAKSINDFSSLLQYLPENATKEMEISIINNDISNQSSSNTNPRINFLINKLLYQPNKLYAWIDYTDYEKAITILWDNVSPEIRCSLRFGIGFNPSELEGLSGIKILTVPSRLLSRWQGDNVVVVMPEDSDDSKGDAEKLLSGQHNDLYNFINQTDLKIKQIEDYLSLQRVLKTFVELDAANLNSLLTLLDTIAVFEDKKSNTEYLKVDIIKQIDQRLKFGTVSEIVRVRNVSFSAIANVELLKTVYQTTYHRAIKLVQSSNNDVIELVSNLIKSNIQPWWNTSIKDALVEFFKDWNIKLVESIVRIIDIGEEPLMKLTDKIIPSTVPEKSFLSVFRSDENRAHSSLWIDFAKRRKWLKVHALFLTRLETLQTALLKQKKLDPDYADKESMEIIIDGYPFAELFQVAKSRQSFVLTSIIAAKCSSNPSCFATFDIKDVFWQEILLILIEQNWDFYANISNAEDAIFSLFDSIIEEKKYNEHLVLKISYDKRIDLFDFPSRKQLWKELKPEPKKNFLNNTSLIFLQNKSIADFESLESDLKRVIQSEETINLFLNNNKNNIGKVLPAFDVIISQEHHLRNFINQYRNEITPMEGAVLGQIIKRKGWNNCVVEMLRKSGHFRSFQNAVSECFEMLSVFDKLLFIIRGNTTKSVSDNDWWNAFLDIAIELFPEGPRQRNIWEEAGGKLHDLALHGNNGREQWIYALRTITNGTAFVTRKKLLHAMLAQYQNNHDLNLLNNSIKDKK